LNASPGFAVTATFGSGRSVVDAARDRVATGAQLPWDLVIMDIEMPHLNGIEATRALKALAPTLPIVVVTVFEDPNTILSAICAGADGYLLKKTLAPDLIEQLRVVLAGGATLTPNIARTVMDLVRSGERPEVEVTPRRLSLTGREQQVLRGLVDGHAYKEIASELEISVDTVRTYIKRLYKKLQVQTASAAVRRAVREGLT